MTASSAKTIQITPTSSVSLTRINLKQREQKSAKPGNGNTAKQLRKKFMSKIRDHQAKFAKNDDKCLEELNPEHKNKQKDDSSQDALTFSKN